MQPEHLIIIGLTILLCLMRHKYRRERERNSRLALDLMRVEFQRVNHKPKAYATRFGGESE